METKTIKKRSSKTLASEKQLPRDHQTAKVPVQPDSGQTQATSATEHAVIKSPADEKTKEASINYETLISSIASNAEKVKQSGAQITALEHLCIQLTDIYRKRRAGGK